MTTNEKGAGISLIRKVKIAIRNSDKNWGKGTTIEARTNDYLSQVKKKELVKLKNSQYLK